MAQTLKNILVVGGTGNQGNLILHALLDKKVFNVRVLIRSETMETKKSLVEAIQAKGGEIVIGDTADLEGLTKAAQGIDVIVSALNINGPAIVINESNLVKAAVAAGVKRIVPCQYGVDNSILPPITPEDKEKIPFLQAVELKRLHLAEIKAAGLEYTQITNSVWYELWYTPVGGFDVQNGKVVVLGDGNQKFTATSMSDVAKFVPEILLDPYSKNQVIRIEGDTLTPNQAVALWEHVSGKKLQVTYRSLEQLQADPGLLSSFLSALLIYPELSNFDGKSDNWRYPQVITTSVKEFFQGMASKLNV